MIGIGVLTKSVAAFLSFELEHVTLSFIQSFQFESSN